MPRCVGCGTDLPASARFCSVCGKETPAPPSTNPTVLPISGAMPQPAMAYTPVAPDNGKGKIALAAGVGAVVLVGAGFLLAKASGLLSANKTETPATGVLSAPPTQTVAAPVLNAPPVAQPDAPKSPVLSPPTAAGNPMPEDIIAYLRWLKQYETARRDLEARGAQQMTLCLQDLIKEYTTGASMGLLDGDSTGSTPPEHKPMNYAAAIGQVIQQWNQATAIFQQKTPPNPCAPLATNYGQALTAGVQQMSALQTTMTNAQASIKGAGGQNTSDAQGALTGLFQQKNSKQMSQSVDGLYAQSNAALDALRGRYTQIPADIDRGQFQIQSGGGSLMLPPSLGL